MFLKEVEEGRKGRNKGLSGGLPRFDKFTNGIQKKMIYLYGGAAKSAKTSIVDHRFILAPYLENKNLKVNWIYFSFEIDLIEKMAKFCAYLMDIKHNIYIDSNYILSRGENRLSDEHLKLVEDIYENELKDLFGVYDEQGHIITKGKIDFHQDRMNPTGIFKYLLAYANNNGVFNYDPYVDSDGVTQQKMVGYTENDPETYTIVIVDHVSLCKKERGFSTKENIDKLSDHMVWFRNLCSFTFVPISQFNRELDKTDRLKFSGEQLSPTLSDYKNTSNLSEDANMILALFAPVQYEHIQRHLGYDIKRIGKSYRSIHILASRNTESGVNIGLMLEGKTGRFIELPKPDEEDRLEKVYEYVEKFKQ